MRVTVFNQALFSPPPDGRSMDLELVSEFLRCEQTAHAKTLVMAWQVVAFAESVDSGSFEPLAFPSLQTAAVEDIGDLLITVVGQKAIDYRNNLWCKFADLGHGSR